MAEVVHGKALDGSIQLPNGANAASKNEASIDRAVAEKPSLDRAASIPQAGRILTGRQEHCTRVS